MWHNGVGRQLAFSGNQCETLCCMLGEEEVKSMSQVKSADEFIQELWSYAREVPMEQHPWFHGIIHHRWAPEQLILGEIQHYLRVRTNPIHWGYIMINAVAARRYELMEVVLGNFMEELSPPRTHVDIMLPSWRKAGFPGRRLTVLSLLQARWPPSR